MVGWGLAPAKWFWRLLAPGIGGTLIVKDSRVVRSGALRAWQVVHGSGEEVWITSTDVDLERVRCLAELRFADPVVDEVEVKEDDFDVGYAMPQEERCT